MKKIIAILLLITFNLSAVEAFNVQLVKDIQMSKSDLYDNALKWVADSFTDSRAVIQMNDKDLGLIVGSSAVNVVTQFMLVPVTETFKYKFKIDVKDNKYRITFTDVIYVGQSYDIPIEETNTGMTMPKATKGLNEVAENLSEYLKNVKKDDDW